MSASMALGAPDLFVLLERDFRRRSRSCPRCTFSLPFRTSGGCPHGANWSVISSGCSPVCESILEDVVASFQRSYRLR